MRRYQLLITVALCVALTSPLLAVEDNKSKVHKKGDKEFYSERFASALTYFEQAKAEDPENHDAIYKAEICSLLSKYGDKSMDVLLSYENTIGRRDKFYNYWLGRIYFRRHEFGPAQTRWERFLKSKVYKSSIIIEETRDLINKSKKAEDHQLNPSQFVVMRLDDHINSPEAEIAPVMVNNDSMLLFATKSPNSTKKKEQYNIYYSTYEGDNWSKPQNYADSDIRVSGGTSLQLMNDGSTLFFNSVKKRSDIFYMDKNNQEWKGMSSLAKKINRYGNDVTFYITDDLDYIIFASNRYTQNEDMNLFESYRIEGDTWAKPIPLIEAINSPYDELSPYLSPDESTLFFSSKGHGSLGGYDVFMSKFNENDSTWGKPVNLGYPLNSVEDDLYFQIAADEKSGFLSSNRYDSRGSMDLYFFYIPEMQIDGMIAWDDDKPVQEATITFASQIDDYNNQVARTDASGRYETVLAAGQSYDVTITWDSEDYHNSELKLQATDVKLDNITKDYVLTKPDEEDSIALTRREMIAQILANLKFPDVDHIHDDHRVEYPVLDAFAYFDFDRDEIVQASIVTLSVYSDMMKTHDDLIVEIAGHTDHIGSEEYNLDLSRRRSEHIAEYFLSHGIPKERMRISYHGEEKLFIDEAHPEAHRVNRRVELILKHVEEY